MRVVDGVCVAWSADEGWGVLRSDDVASDVFVHFSDIRTSGYTTLDVGDAVRFEVEPFPSGQDGYFFRALNVIGLRAFGGGEQSNDRAGR